jgi:sensor histidine kinase regulating citrate/malate metabolism
MKIREKILVPMLILFVTAISALLVVLLLIFQDYTNGDGAQKDISLFMDLMEANLSTDIHIAKNAALFGQENILISQALAEDDMELLADQALHLQEVLDMDFYIITDSQGIVLINAVDSTWAGKDISSMDSVALALKGENFSGVETSDIIPLDVGGAAPIYGSDGVLLGTVLCGYNLDNNVFVDKLKEQIECDATIFLGDTRYTTTLINDDGSRVIGTQAAEESAESSEHLASQADLLQVLTKQFKLS